MTSSLSLLPYVTFAWFSADPVQSKRNISRSISSNAVADLIVDRLRAACLLFGVPRTADGPAVRLVAGRGPLSAAAAGQLADRLAGLTCRQLEYQFDEHLLCGETVSAAAAAAAPGMRAALRAVGT